MVACWQLALIIFTAFTLSALTPALFLTFTSLVCLDALLSLIDFVQLIPILFHGDPPIYKRHPLSWLAYCLLRPFSAVLLALVSIVFCLILLSSCDPSRGVIHTGINSLPFQHPERGPSFPGQGRTLLDDGDEEEQEKAT